MSLSAAPSPEQARRAALLALGISNRPMRHQLLWETAAKILGRPVDTQLAEQLTQQLLAEQKLQRAGDPKLLLITAAGQQELTDTVLEA